MNQTIYAFLLPSLIFSYLIINTVTDIRTKKIPINISALYFFLILLTRIIFDHFNITDSLFSLIPGLVLLIISRITSQSIGYGDCIIFLVTGLASGFQSTFLVIIISFILSGIYGLFSLLKHKSTKSVFPFVPFILISYIIKEVILEASSH